MNTVKATDIYYVDTRIVSRFPLDGHLYPPGTLVRGPRRSRPNRNEHNAKGARRYYGQNNSYLGQRYANRFAND